MRSDTFNRVEALLDHSATAVAQGRYADAKSQILQLHALCARGELSAANLHAIKKQVGQQVAVVTRARRDLLEELRRQRRTSEQTRRYRAVQQVKQ